MRAARWNPFRSNWLLSVNSTTVMPVIISSVIRPRRYLIGPEPAFHIPTGMMHGGESLMLAIYLPFAAIVGPLRSCSGKISTGANSGLTTFRLSLPAPHDRYAGARGADVGMYETFRPYYIQGVGYDHPGPRVGQT